MKKDVFFESISTGHRPLVIWYLARGHRVNVFNFTNSLKSMPWLRKLINEGKISRVEVNHLSGTVDLAMEAAEWLYPKHSQNPLVQCLYDIFGPEEPEAVIKQGLLLQVSQYLSIRLFLQKYLGKAESSATVTLVPDSFCYWDKLLGDWCRERLGPLESVKIPVWARIWSELISLEKRAFENVKHSLYNGISLLSVWLGRRLSKPRDGDWIGDYDHVCAIDVPAQVRFQGPRNFDFLLDNERLTKENTAFLVSRGVEGPWMDEARSSGYHIIARSQFGDERHPSGHLRSPPRKADLGPLAKTVVLGAFRGSFRPLAPEWLVQTAALGVSTYISESCVLERVGYVNYIYRSQDDLRQRWRNALIRKAGRQSWNFAYAIGGGYFHDEGEEFGGLHRLWTYQNPDHYVAPSPQMVEYQKRHHQVVREYHEVGNIWSELVRIESETRDREEALSQWFNGSHRGKRVVAWFDSSVVEAENSGCTYTEAIAWYAGIQKLLEEDENLLVVIKPSKPPSYFLDPAQEWSHPLGAVLMEKWDELKGHPRVHFAGHDSDPVSVIAMCDLTVTYCFSSCTAEALGAGKPAIWSEPGERWRNTLYGREPLLAAHGYEELRSLVTRLLYDISADQYQQFLQERLLGLVESFLDGRGLSRFRELLHEAARSLPEGDPVAVRSGR